VPSKDVKGMRTLSVLSDAKTNRLLAIAFSCIATLGSVLGVTGGLGFHLPRSGSLEEGAGPIRVKVLS